MRERADERFAASWMQIWTTRCVAQCALRSAIFFWLFSASGPLRTLFCWTAVSPLAESSEFDTLPMCPFTIGGHTMRTPRTRCQMMRGQYLAKRAATTTALSSLYRLHQPSGAALWTSLIKASVCNSRRTKFGFIRIHSRPCSSWKASCSERIVKKFSFYSRSIRDLLTKCFSIGVWLPRVTGQV